MLIRRTAARIGAWHVLPNSIYEQHLLEHNSALPESVFDLALRTAPTVLYFHGNAATRAASNRVRVARYMSSENRNFVIIDYRFVLSPSRTQVALTDALSSGFADSTGVPTERGLYLDARRFWDWLTLEKGAKAGEISVMGQSLGTGVTTSLVSTLANEGSSFFSQFCSRLISDAGITPRSMILVAPFASIPRLLKTYKLGMIIPILGPLKAFPALVDTFLKTLYTRFDTIAVISVRSRVGEAACRVLRIRLQSIKCPILLLHAQNDRTIPYTHSHDLFEHLASSESVKATTRSEWGKWGSVLQLERVDAGRVVLGAANSGNHNNIGSEEMSLRLMNEIMK